MTTLQIAIITGAGFLYIGYVGCSLFDLYRKGGQRDLENWLDEEVDLNVGLLNHIEDVELALKNERKITEALRESLSKESEPLYVRLESWSCAACRKSGTGIPETICCDSCGEPWDVRYKKWNCALLGHHFGVTNSDGEAKRRCIHCDLDGGSAA